jgi:hypothetical protein
MDVKNFKNRRLMTTNMFIVKEVVLPKENDDNLSIYGEYTLPDVDIFSEGDVITYSEVDGLPFYINSIPFHISDPYEAKDGIEIYNSKEARENIKPGTMLFVKSSKRKIEDTIIVVEDKETGKDYVNHWGMADNYAMRVHDYNLYQTLADFRKYNYARKGYLAGFAAAKHVFTKELEKLNNLMK